VGRKGEDADFLSDTIETYIKDAQEANKTANQSNTCSNEAECSNEESNEANVFGYSSAANDYDEDFDFGTNVDISQSIEQSNTCSGRTTCSNIASNVANIG
jgi:hypothetical protein